MHFTTFEKHNLKKKNNNHNNHNNSLIFLLILISNNISIHLYKVCYNVEYEIVQFSKLIYLN